MFRKFVFVGILSLGAFIRMAIASEGPSPIAFPAEIPAPRDTPYPGVIKLAVDATDVSRHIFRIEEHIPVSAGAIILLYPQWIPGKHWPAGRIDAVAGLTITANGKPIAWARDTVNVFAFHIDVPPGTRTLDVAFQFLSGGDGNEDRIVMTEEMLNLQWNSLLLYPAGYYARQIPIEPSVKLPPGWQYGIALEAASTAGDTSTFKTVPLETLVDSPMFAGKYFKRIDLGSMGTAPVRLNVMADRPELLEAKPEHLEAHRALVRQADRLFGAHHFDHYDLLLALTDRMGGIGLEHHRSSENGTVATYFTEWDKNEDTRDLLPHEFTHSWNGKFRRPADLWTANYSVPMRDSLLWVYEGQTQYWGFVLAARAGLLTKQQALDAIAQTAAAYDYRIGREWKTLQDTTNDPIVAFRRALPWRSWQRSEDYYSEGQLVWLDADTLIRERSKGAKSLDDFARGFFGMNDGSYVPVTYSFNDVVRALNAIQPNDWAQFLRTRLESHGHGAPLDGVTRGGYKLIYKDKPTDYDKNEQTRRKITDLTFSIGVVIGREGRLNDVRWNGPAHNAGLTAGTHIVAVNGFSFETDRIKDAIKAAQKTGAPIELLVKNGDRYNTVKIDYRDGLRYPHFERDEAKPALLDRILEPRS